MAAPVIASSSTDTTSGTANTTLVFSAPSGLAKNDLIVILAANEAASANNWPSITTPDLYTIEKHSDSSGAVQLAVYWKVCDGNETWPLTITASGTSDYAVGWCLRITGASINSPLFAFGSWVGVNSSNVGNIAITGIDTTGTDDCLILAFAGSDGSDVTPNSITSGTGWTNAVSTLEDTANSGTGVGAGYTYKTQATGGATSTVTLDGKGTGTDGMTGIQMAIRPLATEDQATYMMMAQW
jgi:hypothetical protein